MSVYQLSKPITAYGEEVSELELREPTTKDARIVNALPYTFQDASGIPALVPQACARYIERLASLPASAVDQIALVDFNTLSWEIAGHFLAQESAPQTTESDG